MHDQTAVSREGIAEPFRLRPMSKVQVDSRYLVLAMEFPNQVTVPPPKPNSDACGDEKYACLVQRRRQSSARICVERANAELRQ